MGAGAAFLLLVFFRSATCMYHVIQMKAGYLPNHVFIGVFTYFGAAFTAIIGIQDKNSALGCGYDFTLTEPDYDPAAHYWNIYSGCRLSNGLGKCPGWIQVSNRTSYEVYFFAM